MYSVFMRLTFANCFLYVKVGVGSLINISMTLVPFVDIYMCVQNAHVHIYICLFTYKRKKYNLMLSRFWYGIRDFTYTAYRIIKTAYY